MKKKLIIIAISISIILLISPTITYAQEINSESHSIEISTSDDHISIKESLKIKGNNDQAQTFFRKAIELDPTHEKAKKELR